MNTATLPRKERRRLKRIERKKTFREQKNGTESTTKKKNRWGVAFATFLAILAVSATTAAVIASNRSTPASETKAIAQPSPQLRGDYIVQVFVGSPPSKQEILKVAKATADWHRGKMNPAGTEMWVSPSQQFWVSNRNATVTAANLKPGDRLLQHDGTAQFCTGVLLRPIVSDNDFAAAYQAIHGSNASVPIGEPGMYLSKVTETFERETQELYQIFYGSVTAPSDLSPLTLSSKELEARSREVNSGAGGSVFVTGEHPYYVLNKAKFVPVKELEPGDRFRDVGGNQLAYHGRRLIRSKPGDPFKVYNIEVADNHTYFAGKEGVWAHNLCSAGMWRMAVRFDDLVEKVGIDEAAKRILAIVRKDKKMNEVDYVDVASYINLRKASGGNPMPRPQPWRHQDDFTPDPRMVEEARAYRVEKGLLNQASMNRNVAVAKVKVDGEVIFLKEANQPFPGGGGSLHSEEALAIQIRELRQQGKQVEVEELFTERIPCTETGGCRRVITSEMSGANVFFWTTGSTSKSKAADLATIYGL